MPNDDTPSHPQKDLSENDLSEPDISLPSSQRDDAPESGGLWSKIKGFFTPKTNGHNLREALEEYIEEADGEETESVSAHERTLIANILKMRDLTVVDVMIPRADIAAIDVDTSQDDLLKFLSERQFSRIPVYSGTLDKLIGTIHIKDILATLSCGETIDIRAMIREVPVVSPAMPVMDLMLEMRESKKHMALVVDEFGGIDGLVTIGDVLEAVIGEFDDEFEQDDEPQMIRKSDGTILANARLDIEEFEEECGLVLNAEDHEDIDTLGGLVFSIAGRVPARGEVIKHESGLVFEIIDADPRRVHILRIKNLPHSTGTR